MDVLVDEVVLGFKKGREDFEEIGEFGDYECLVM